MVKTTSFVGGYLFLQTIIDYKEHRFETPFKNCWNRGLMKANSGLCTSVEDSRDFDLPLHGVARVGNRKVVHVSHILYYKD